MATTKKEKNGAKNLPGAPMEPKAGAKGGGQGNGRLLEKVIAGNFLDLAKWLHLITPRHHAGPTRTPLGSDRRSFSGQTWEWHGGHTYIQRVGLRQKWQGLIIKLDSESHAPSLPALAPAIHSPPAL